MSDYTQTPNFGLFKPTPDADDDLWGEHWNINADTLDAALQAQASGYLPLSGGILTGLLTLRGVTTDTSGAGNIDLYSPDINDPTARSGEAYMWSGTNGGDGTSGWSGHGSGNTAGAGDTGGAEVWTGVATGTGKSGDISIYTGSAFANSSGFVSITTGTAAGAGNSSGDIQLKTGTSQDTIATRGSITLDAPMTSVTGALALAGHVTSTWPITILWNDTTPSYAAFGFWDTNTGTGFGFFPYTPTILAISVINSQGGATSPGFQFNTATGVFSIPGSGGLHLANVNTDPSSVVGGIEMYPGFGGFGVTANTLNYNWAGLHQFLAGSTPIMQLGTGGQTMQTPLWLWRDPTQPNEAATKAYVDAHASGIADAPNNANTYGRHAAAWSTVLPLAGGTLTGALTLAADPAAALQAATKQYVDAHPSGIADAPNDANSYGRHAAAWAKVVPVAARGSIASLALGEPANIAPTSSMLSQFVVTTNIGFSIYYDGSAWRYLNNGYGFLQSFDGNAGKLTWFGFATGVAGAVASAVQLAQLDSGGNFSVRGNLAVNNGDNSITAAPDGQYLSLKGTSPYLSYSTYVINGGGRASYAHEWYYFTTRIMTLDVNGNLAMTGTCSAASYPGPSDARIKKNIQPWTTRGLADVIQLQPVSFQFNGEGGMTDDGITRYGVIAQEAQPYLPEAVTVMAPATSPDLPDPEPRSIQDQLAFDNGTLVFALVNAIKELATRVVALEAAR